MINIVINLFGGQAYEITDRYTAPRSSSAQRYRNDPWYTGSLIRQLPLEPHDWLRVMEKVRRRPLEIFSNHPAEVYDAVTEAVMRGELAIYKLPQLDATHCVRGKNAKNTGLCFVRGPDAHCATELTPEPIGSVEAAKALLDEIGISEKLFLGELAYKDLYNSYQQRDPMQTALKMLASGEILAYKIPIPPMAKPPKPVEYEDTSGPKYQPVPLAPETKPKPAAGSSVIEPLKEAPTKLTPLQQDIELAKSVGNSAEHIAARELVARNFLESNGYSKSQINQAIGSVNGEIVGGVDLMQPLEIVSFPPPDTMSQYVMPHGYPGNWFDPIGGQTPGALGINGNTRTLKNFMVPKGKGLKSYSKPILDNWTEELNPVQTEGGGVQLFVNDVIKKEVVRLNINGGTQ